jgi:undecaprenyl-diphosphatase
MLYHSIMNIKKIALIALSLLALQAHAQSGGPLGIDHKLPLDESGIWDRGIQKGVGYAAIVTVVGGSLYEGNQTRLGKTYWKALDSMLIANGATVLAKMAFGRERPSQTDDPNSFFKRNGDASFPGGEITHITSVVTPFIFEYAQDTPAVWGLLALPAYIGVARLKSQAHWQSDILAGAALGTGIGYWSYKRENASLTAGLFGDGVFIGWKTKF